VEKAIHLSGNKVELYGNSRKQDENGPLLAFAKSHFQGTFK
jgi:hypothetical protein